MQCGPWEQLQPPSTRHRCSIPPLFGLGGRASISSRRCAGDGTDQRHGVGLRGGAAGALHREDERLDTGDAPTTCQGLEYLVVPASAVPGLRPCTLANTAMPLDDSEQGHSQHACIHHRVVEFLFLFPAVDLAKITRTGEPENSLYLFPVSFSRKTGCSGLRERSRDFPVAPSSSRFRGVEELLDPSRGPTVGPAAADPNELARAATTWKEAEVPSTTTRC
jgi:hypothetical protein